MEELNLYGSICLSDIPKELIITATNGKKYLGISVRERREVGQYGHTHYIKASQRKDVTLPEGVNLFIGDLKPSQPYQQPQQPPQYQPAAPMASPNPDLPF